MKFLLDITDYKVQKKQAEYPNLVIGQLCTPLTRRENWGGVFAIDNGAFSGLNKQGFYRCLKKHEPYMEKCLFVAVPDIVGNHRRTDELYGLITQEEEMLPWTKKWSFVAQDGIEDARIDWYAINYLFIGGTDRFKDSSAAYDVVKTAKALDIPVHVGRVNTAKRFLKYADLGADTCDGSGACKYDWMLEEINIALGIKPEPTLFDECEEYEHTQNNNSREMSA